MMEIIENQLRYKLVGAERNFNQIDVAFRALRFPASNKLLSEWWATYYAREKARSRLSNFLKGRELIEEEFKEIPGL